MKGSYSSSDLARLLGTSVHGEDRPVMRLAAPEGADPGSIVVVAEAAQLERLASARPAAVVIPSKLEQQVASLLPEVPYLVVDDPRWALAILSERFDTRPSQPPGIAASARISAGAQLGHGLAVGPGAVIGDDAVVGDEVRIGANCVVGSGVRLGRGCVLHPGVVIYDGAVLGERVVVHANAVIGADGFGYAPSPAGARKIHHLGSVEIHDDVEIGALTAIDRGTLDNTRIGARTKIDNHCQIGHNVQIGSDCLIAGMSGIAGSTRIGDRVIVGGYVAIADHLEIGDDVRIAGGAGVSKNIPAGETWAGAPAMPYRKFVRRLYLLGQLERIWQAVKGLGRG